jgi:hypothetical protein
MSLGECPSGRREEAIPGAGESSIDSCQGLQQLFLHYTGIINI